MQGVLSCLTAAAIFGLAFAGPADARRSWFESLSGDLPGKLTEGVDFGVLDAGGLSVFGDLTGAEEGVARAVDPQDSFRFTAETPFTMTALSTGARLRVTLLTPGFELAWSSMDGIDMFGEMAAGEYLVGIVPYANTGAAVYGIAVSSTLDAVEQAVEAAAEDAAAGGAVGAVAISTPVPAAGPLLLGGLVALGLGAARRRRGPRWARRR